MARYFGWAAVDTEPMDWTDYQLARQLLAEERVGQHVRDAEAHEAAAFEAAKSQLSRG